MGPRPPSIIATDLTREAAKYREAHSKANESNQNLHRAMTTHVANLKILSLPLPQIKQQIPAIVLPNCKYLLIYFTENLVNSKSVLIYQKTNLIFLLTFGQTYVK